MTTYAPLAVVNWTNEEGARFLPSMLGSGVWCGKYTVEFAHERSDAGGNKLGDELRRIGYLDAASVECSYMTNPLSAHLEVHIEQGPVLDENRESVAVVSGIQAIRWYGIQLIGRESHAGTTPMNRRRDALLAAARVIDSVNHIATTSESIDKGLRTTVGVINSMPQAINTIAGQVELFLDLRSPSDDEMNSLDEECQRSINAIAKRMNIEVRLNPIFDSPALHFNNTASTCIGEAALARGYRRQLISGAGHDRQVTFVSSSRWFGNADDDFSMYTARHCPTGMIFVRCRGGVSHHPSEYSRPEDCAEGAQVLLDAYLMLDEHFRQRRLA
ncbi:hypothetical protein CLAIMM_00957 [Cladophialophora immunda]|nr:hypothetical protein CLAIMM_00957 [Cladophialophora immunda]